MKRYPASIRTLSVSLPAFLLCLLWLAASPAAARAQSDLPKGEVVIEGTLETGSPVTARFDLKGYDIPRGAYASVNTALLKRPEGDRPRITPGYPETVMVFRTPGTYRLLLILSEVTKSSCGGVDAVTLLESEKELVISPEFQKEYQ